MIHTTYTPVPRDCFENLEESIITGMSSGIHLSDCIDIRSLIYASATRHLVRPHNLYHPTSVTDVRGKAYVSY